jgi:hypothetical protein
MTLPEILRRCASLPEHSAGDSDDAAAVPARDRAHSPTPTMEG